MTQYIRLSDGAYPRTLVQIKSDFPDVSFPDGWAPNAEELAAFGHAEVVAVERPDPEPGHYVVEGAPALVDGVWTQTWDVQEQDPADIATETERLRKEALRANALAAEAARSAWLTAGEGKKLAYQAKKEEAFRWRDAGQVSDPEDPGYPSAEDYPWAARRAQRRGVAIHEALLEHLTLATTYQQIGIDIEDEYDRVVMALEAATTPAEVIAARDSMNYEQFLPGGA